VGGGPADLQPGPSRRVAFDVEVLWLARQLRLEVAEVHVQALERQGSKVKMVADALEMLGEVWAVRQEAPHRGFSEVGPALTRSPKVAASAADPQLGKVATPAGAPAALPAS
jgi:hypothetical protein